MAGDWIKVEHWTPDKPEIFLLADELGIDPDAVVGKLVRLWVWADQHTVDGNAASVTESLLDRVSGVTGFAQALINVGWMQISGTGYAFTHFSRHNGQTAKTRALSRDRVAKHRSGNAAVTPAKQSGNAASVTESLPEKRREDIIEPPALLDSSSSLKETGGPPLAEIVDAVDKITGTKSRWTAKRKVSAQVRWLDEHWRSHWREAAERARESSFLTGDNDRGWRMDLEFFLRPDTVVKILEGKYDDREGAQKQRLTANQQRESVTANSFDLIRRAAAEHAAAIASGNGCEGDYGHAGAIVFSETHG